MKKQSISVIFELASGVSIIFLALWLGRWLSVLSKGILPASIMGMLLLTLLLQLDIVRLRWVESAANQFVRWMSLLFVPISIGLVDHIETLLQALPAMLVSCVVATLLLLVAVGRFYQYWERQREDKNL